MAGDEDDVVSVIFSSPCVVAAAFRAVMCVDLVLGESDLTILE